MRNGKRPTSPRVSLVAARTSAERDRQGAGAASVGGGPDRRDAADASAAGAPAKMMLGFVVRQCAVVLGHNPSAEELAEWANDQRDGTRRYCIFGRAISVDEARVLLRHPERPVTVRRASPRVLFALGRAISD